MTTKPHGWGIYREHVLLRVCLSWGMAEEIAYCSKEAKDFNTSEEWFIYRDSAIREAKNDPTNPYTIKPLYFVPSALLDWVEEVETFLAAIPNNREETEWRENVARHLLDKLREIRE